MVFRKIAFSILVLMTFGAIATVAGAGDMSSVVSTKRLQVDKILYSNYTPIRKYVDLTGGYFPGDGAYNIALAEYQNKTPNLKTLFSNLFEKGIYINHEISSFDEDGNLRQGMLPDVYYLYAQTAIPIDSNNDKFVDPIVDTTDECASWGPSGGYGGCLDNTYRCPEGSEVYEGKLCMKPCAAVYGGGKTGTFIQGYRSGRAQFTSIPCSSCLVANCVCDDFIVETDGNTGVAGICVENDPDTSAPINASANGSCTRADQNFTLNGCPRAGYKCNNNYMVYQGQCLDPLDGILIGRENAAIDEENCGVSKFAWSYNVKNGCAMPNVKCNGDRFAYTGAGKLTGHCLDLAWFDNAHEDQTCNNKTDLDYTYQGCVMDGYRCDDGYQVLHGRCKDPCGGGIGVTLDASCTSAKVKQDAKSPVAGGCMAANCRCKTGKYPVHRDLFDPSSGYCADEPFGGAAVQDSSCTGPDPNNTYAGCIASGWRCKENYDVLNGSNQYGCQSSCAYVEINSSWNDYNTYKDDAIMVDPTCEASYINDGWNSSGPVGGCIKRHCRCKSPYKPVKPYHSSDSCSFSCEFSVNSTKVPTGACEGQPRCVTTTCLCDRDYHPENGTCVENEIKHSVIVGESTCPTNTALWKSYYGCVAPSYSCQSPLYAPVSTANGLKCGCAEPAYQTSDDGPDDDKICVRYTGQTNSDIKITVSYSCDGGGVNPRSQTINSGEKVTLPGGVCTKGGEANTGWKCYGKQYVAGAEYRPAADRTCSAQWSGEGTTYTTTFDCGSGQPKPGTSLPVYSYGAEGTTVTCPNGADYCNANNGGNFSYWACSNISTPRNAGVTFTIGGMNVTCSARYVIPNACANISGSGSKTGDATCTEVSPNGTQGGCAAEGCRCGFDSYVYIPYEGRVDCSATPPSNTDPTTYTVSYNCNGGSGSISSGTCTAGETVNPVSVNGCGTRTNYTLDGWDASSKSCNGNVTFTAQWKDVTPTIYTVSYDCNGGSGSISSGTCTAGETVNPVSVNGCGTRTNYTLDGWDASSKSCNGNVTFTAQWTETAVNPTTYTVSYDCNGGSGSISSGTCTAGETVNPVSVNGCGTKANYALNGWDAPSKSCNGNVTFTAQWWTPDCDTETQLVAISACLTDTPDTTSLGGCVKTGCRCKSDLLATANANCVDPCNGMENTELDTTNVFCKSSNNSDVCLNNYCKCKSGYKPNNDRTSCEFYDYCLGVSEWRYNSEGSTFSMDLDTCPNDVTLSLGVPGTLGGCVQQGCKCATGLYPYKGNDRGVEKTWCATKVTVTYDCGEGAGGTSTDTLYGGYSNDYVVQDRSSQCSKSDTNTDYTVSGWKDSYGTIRQVGDTVGLVDGYSTLTAQYQRVCEIGSVRSTSCTKYEYGTSCPKAGCQCISGWVALSEGNCKSDPCGSISGTDGDTEILESCTGFKQGSDPSYSVFCAASNCSCKRPLSSGAYYAPVQDGSRTYCQKCDNSNNYCSGLL